MDRQKAKREMAETEQPSHVMQANPIQNYGGSRIISSEIVEIGEDSRSFAHSRDDVLDVYVAVGKDDIHVLKWALDHLVSRGTRIFLVHVYPPITYITTPVGRLSRNQLSHDQVRFYINEEHNRRRNILQKYIKLCNDAKVTVDTMLLESNEIAKAILQLIPVLNITNLVIGTSGPLRSRLLRKKISKAEYVTKNSPEYCQVFIVEDRKKTAVAEQTTDYGRRRRHDVNGNSEKKFFECACFSGNFSSN